MPPACCPDPTADPVRTARPSGPVTVVVSSRHPSASVRVSDQVVVPVDSEFDPPSGPDAVSLAVDVLVPPPPPCPCMSQVMTVARVPSAARVEAASEVNAQV
ncbi:hypothetical protein J0H58_06600 [bacterium]|nr:hypothetical protein [bacterium]